MKKIISVLLAVLMMCSFQMFAFAAENDTITEGEENSYTLAKDSVTDLTFIPENTGIYRIDLAFKDSAEVTNSNIEAAVYYQNSRAGYTDIQKIDLESLYSLFYQMMEEGELTLKDESYLYFVAEQGETFTLKLSSTAYMGVAGLNYDDNTDVTVKVEKVDAPELKSGEIYTVSSASNVYYVAPENDTVYNITSDMAGVSVTIKDVYGYCGTYYFDATQVLNGTFKFEGGKIYSVTVKYYDNGEEDEIYTETEGEPYPFDFSVNDGTTVLPTGLYAEPICLIKGTSEDMYVSVLPYGSEMNGSGLEVSVENEKIATVEYNGDDNWFTVYAHKAGTTTVTFTEPVSGATTTVEIEVITKFQYYLYVIEYYISDFFAQVADFFSNLFN